MTLFSCMLGIILISKCLGFSIAMSFGLMGLSQNWKLQVLGFLMSGLFAAAFILILIEMVVVGIGHKFLFPLANSIFN